jgi:hypothetical protein
VAPLTVRAKKTKNPTRYGYTLGLEPAYCSYWADMLFTGEGEGPVKGYR